MKVHIKWLEVDEMGWKWMKAGENEWTRMKVVENGWKNMKVDESGWKWMKVVEREWKRMKWMKVYENGWKWSDEKNANAWRISPFKNIVSCSISLFLSFFLFKSFQIDQGAISPSFMVLFILGRDSNANREDCKHWRLQRRCAGEGFSLECRAHWHTLTTGN